MARMYGLRRFLAGSVAIAVLLLGPVFAATVQETLELTIDEVADIFDDNDNTLELLQAISDRFEDIDEEDQYSRLDIIATNLSVVKSTLTGLNISYDKTMTVLEFVLDATQDEYAEETTADVTPVDTASSSSDAISYEIYDAREAGKKVVVFSINDTPSRATWHRLPYKIYTCRRNQCSRIGQLFDEGDVYEITVYIRYNMFKTARETLTIDLR